MVRKKFIALAICLLLIFTLTGCGTFSNITDTPEVKAGKAYMKASKELALTQKKYNDYWDKADAATQEKWKAEIDPKFKLANKALDSWKMVIDDGMSPESQEKLYLELKAELFLLLVDVFRLKEE